VVNAGSDGWAIDLMADVLAGVVNLLAPGNLVLLAPTRAAAAAWRRVSGLEADIEIAEGVTDISGFLHRSRWFLTKGGGTPIAEGLVAGCRVLARYSGIPWEDRGIDWLATRGQVVPVGAHFPLEWSRYLIDAPEPATATLRQTLKRSARAIWEHLEDGTPEASLEEQARVAAVLLSDIQQESIPAALPETTAALQNILSSWLL
jgi:hypothetical protein